MRTNNSRHSQPVKPHSYAPSFLTVWPPCQTSSTNSVQYVICDFSEISLQLSLRENACNFYRCPGYMRTRHAATVVNQTTGIKNSGILFVETFAFFIPVHSQIHGMAADCSNYVLSLEKLFNYLCHFFPRFWIVWTAYWGYNTGYCTHDYWLSDLSDLRIPYRPSTSSHFSCFLHHVAVGRLHYYVHYPYVTRAHLLALSAC